MQIIGTYHSGSTSQSLAATIEYSSSLSDHLILITRDESGAEHRQNYTMVGCQIEPRLGNSPREVNLSEGGLFVTDDHAGIDALTENAHVTKGNNWIHTLESHLGLVLVSTVLVLCLIFASFQYGIPYAAKVVAFTLPEFTENEYIDTLDILDRAIFDPTKLSNKRQEHVQSLLAPYLAEYRDLRPKVFFRAGSGANAFALPGGEIIFTDDFIHLVTSDEEILAVFFHEIGHLKHKHSIRRGLQDSMVTLLLFFITGDLDTADIITGIPTLMMDFAYLRQFETEADLFSLEQITRYNLSTEAFANIMDLLSKQHHDADSDVNFDDSSDKEVTNNIGAYFSTHPPTKQRIELIRSYKAK